MMQGEIEVKVGDLLYLKDRNCIQMAAKVKEIKFTDDGRPYFFVERATTQQLLVFPNSIAGKIDPEEDWDVYDFCKRFIFYEDNGDRKAMPKVETSTEHMED